MQSQSHLSKAPGTIPALPLASLPCCQCCKSGHCLPSSCAWLPAAKGQYCLARCQLPGVTVLDQLLTWHKPARRKVDDVLKGEKKQEENDSSLAKSGGKQRSMCVREVNLRESPWGKAPTSPSTVRGGYLSFVRIVLSPEKRKEKLVFKIGIFLVIKHWIK